MPEKPEACECCHHKTTELTFFREEVWHKIKIEWLCSVCANTHLPGLKRNPTFEGSERVEIMTHITLCANLIIDVIKGK